MQTTINQRIKVISEKLCNGNISELSRIAGVNQPALRDIVGSKQAKPGFEILNKIVDSSILNINAGWLLTGKGEMQLSKTYSPAAKINIDTESSAEYEINNYKDKYIEVLEENRRLYNEIKKLTAAAGV